MTAPPRTACQEEPIHGPKWKRCFRMNHGFCFESSVRIPLGRICCCVEAGESASNCAWAARMILSELVPETFVCQTNLKRQCRMKPWRRTFFHFTSSAGIPPRRNCCWVEEYESGRNARKQPVQELRSFVSACNDSV